jgi:hypothetical protein
MTKSQIFDDLQSKNGNLDMSQKERVRLYLENYSIFAFFFKNKKKTKDDKIVLEILEKANDKLDKDLNYKDLCHKLNKS